MQTQARTERPLADLVPPGALLYLEARDFHSLLNNWNTSAEKKTWLASDNFSVLSQSRLIQRLAQAQSEFVTIAGIPVEMNLLDQAAGRESAFAFYNLPNLTFVYLTRLDDSRLNENSLWQHRTGYQSRSVADIPFYSKSQGGADGRTVAIASFQGWFVLTTDETLMAQTLSLLASRRAPALSNDDWFQNTIKQSTAQGDLRLVYNLAALLKTPQFRTYWIQRNASELEPFASGVADLFLQNDGFKEQRALLRRAAAAPVPVKSALEALLRYVPANSSLYRAWAAPDTDILVPVLQQVVLSQPVQSIDYARFAPQINGEGPQAGSISDLETRIDQPPFQRAAAATIAPLAAAISVMQPTALLHVQATMFLNDQVFVVPQSAAVITCAHPDRQALDKALADVAGIEKTGSLDPLNMVIEGNDIVLTRFTLEHGAASVAPANANYIAGYNHAEEWPRYKPLFRLIDRSANSPEEPVSSKAPAFFSGNLRSLGDMLDRLQRATIQSQDEGTVVRDTLMYQLSPK